LRILNLDDGRKAVFSANHAGKWSDADGFFFTDYGRQEPGPNFVFHKQSWCLHMFCERGVYKRGHTSKAIVQGIEPTSATHKNHQGIYIDKPRERGIGL
jgi:hypothetical protein